jgi:hypothetical protein
MKQDLRAFDRDTHVDDPAARYVKYMSPLEPEAGGLIVTQ